MSRTLRGRSVRATRIRVAATGAAVVGALVAGATGCSSADDVSVVDRRQAFDLAAGASYDAGSAGFDRTLQDGTGVTVAAQYSEPLRVGDWVAADECSFNTTLDVAVGTARWSSPPFEGPSSDADDTAGWVGGLIDLPARAVDQSAGVETTTTSSTGDTDPSAGATTTVIVGSGDGVVTTLEGIDEPGPIETLPDDTLPDDTIPDDTVPNDSGVTTSMVGGADEPPADQRRTLAVVVAFGHRSVATLRATPSDAEPQVDTQPLDGWALLAVPVLPAADGTLPPLTLELRDESGEATAEPVDLSAPDFREQLGIGTPAWRFDAARVTDACRAPEGAAANTTTSAPSDILAQPIAPMPALPAPGPGPDDPTDATADALAAIRTMYDMADPTDATKAAVAEDPQVAARILDELRRKEVLQPFLAKLDPTFGPLVFTSPTSASVVYRVGPTYQWEVGRVVVVDGTWRVASGTICRDLADASYTCPSDITPDPPPGPLGGQRIPGG